MVDRLLRLPDGTLDVSDLDDVRRATLSELAYAMLLLAWLVALRGLWTRRLDTLAVAALLAGGVLLSSRLQARHFRAARYTLVFSLITAAAGLAWLFPASIARYCFPVVVIASSLLVSHASVFGVAALWALAYFVVARLQGAGLADADRLGNPILLIGLTAFASWLGSRQLHVALAWMQNSYAQARGALEELRDRRAALARTLKALEEAYGRIEHMNYVLAEARSTAEEARRLKAEFAANISHELRTPLSLIIGFSETMANAPETYGDMAWPRSLRGDVEQIYRASCHLSSLVDDILDLSALDVQRMPLVLEEVHIGDVIADAVSVVNELFRAKGLYLKVDIAPDLPRMRLDPTRIRQVLLNLLNNASRYTTEGGVTVAARCEEGQALVAVADTGVGIAPADMPKVFEEFRQVDGSVRRRHGGTGLGVPLSRRLVELHGGRMWVESTPGKGSTFTFALPLESPAGPPGSGLLRGPLPAAGAQPRSLLVAEPDPLLLRTLRRHLAGYEVAEVRDPAEVASVAEQRQPCALVVDSQTVETFSALSEWTQESPASLPVIAIGMRGPLAEAQALGARDYFVKPLVRRRLLEALTQLGEGVRRILVVDDDLRFVELVSRTLQSAGRGYEPIKAFGGAEALTRLRRERPDAVLLDLAMPEVDGVAVLSAMRADPSLATVPAIVVSGREDADAAQTGGGQALGLQRPQGFTVGEMLSCLQGLLASLPPQAPSGRAPTQGQPAVPGAPPVSPQRRAPRAKGRGRAR